MRLKYSEEYFNRIKYAEKFDEEGNEMFRQLREEYLKKYF